MKSNQAPKLASIVFVAYIRVYHTRTYIDLDGISLSTSIKLWIEMPLIAVPLFCRYWIFAGSIKFHATINHALIHSPKLSLSPHFIWISSLQCRLVKYELSFHSYTYYTFNCATKLLAMVAQRTSATAAQENYFHIPSNNIYLLLSDWLWMHAPVCAVM